VRLRGLLECPAGTCTRIARRHTRPRLSCLNDEGKRAGELDAKGSTSLRSIP
jgi:hypothetical protein